MLKYVWAAIVFAAMLVAGPARATEPVALTYTAPANVQAGTASIRLGQVTDARENDRDWFGAIRGGYGNPLKVLRTVGPVSDTIRSAFQAAIEARGMSADAGHRLEVRLVRFDCSQYSRKEAHIVMELTLYNASGGVLYQRTTSADRVEGSILTLRTGIFASVEELRAVANATMQEGIDQALDDPGLRGALAQAAQQSAPPADALAVPSAPSETPAQTTPESTPESAEPAAATP